MVVGWIEIAHVKMYAPRWTPQSSCGARPLRAWDDVDRPAIAHRTPTTRVVPEPVGSWRRLASWLVVARKNNRGGSGRRVVDTGSFWKCQWKDARVRPAVKTNDHFIPTIPTRFSLHSINDPYSTSTTYCVRSAFLMC